jgi:putative tryptophan/tyrosine transport system substrate-binding protein
VTSLNVEVGAKRLELLHELVPTASTIVLLVNPTNALTEATTTNVQTAAHALGVQLPVLNASTERDFDAAFARLVQLQAGGLVIAPDAFFISRSEQLARLALRHSVPAIFQYREFAAAGGLISYGGSRTDAYRQVGAYTPAGFSKAQSPPICPWFGRASSSWCSISKPRGRSASISPTICSYSPTR